MIPVEEAQAACLALVKPLPGEEVPLAEAGGRVLFAPAHAGRDQPPFAAAAMDGYALREAELGPGAGFEVIGEAAAGHGWTGTVGPGQAVRIFTGAPVPAGADHVVIQEDVARDGGRITILPSLGEGPNIRPQGADFRQGDRMEAPRLLSPADLALLAAMNVAKVGVTIRPRVLFLATGDELVMPGALPGPDQIVASNVFGLKAMVEAAGGAGVILPIAPDREDALIEAMAGMLSEADIAVTIGGASVGDHDLVGRTAETLGVKRSFYKIAMRPGKPLIAGSYGAAAYLGLPGNPVSALVCGAVFLVPMVRKMLGLGDVLPQPREARLGADVGPNGPRAHYMRARLDAGIVTPFDRQDSSLLSILSNANALLIRPPGDGPRRAGDRAQYLEF